MSERIRIPAVVIVLVLAATGAFAVLRQPDEPLFVFPDDGQTWIAFHSVSVDMAGTPIVRYPWGVATLTASDGSTEIIEIAQGSRGPFVVESSGAVEFCLEGRLSGRCRDLVIEHGTLYEFWTDTDEVFTTKSPTKYRVRDGGCFDLC